MGKKDKRKSEGDDGEMEDSWNEKIQHLNAIANPVASKKLTKRLYKIVKKAAKEKQLRKGVREVQKFIRKGEKGIVILAGDTNPVDVYSHIPVVCEELGLPYCYVPSKEDLGAAYGSKRATCMVMVKAHSEYQDAYEESEAVIKSLPIPT